MCGATSYRSVIDRDGTGALRPTSLLQCSGCSVVFVDPKAWRDGEAETPQQAAPGLVVPPTPVVVHAASTPKALASDFKTYGLSPDATGPAQPSSIAATS